MGFVMDSVQALSYAEWNPAVTPVQAADFAQLLEAGRVLYLPRLAFELDSGERRFLSQEWLDGGSKSLYLKGQDRSLRGAAAQGRDRANIQSMIERFGLRATRLVHALFPMYGGHLQPANTSFRPCEASGRKQSWRHDDTRLHTDAFPSQPLQGKRILRVFTNVNPQGKARLWRIGEPFPEMAAKFLPLVRRPLPGKHAVLNALGVTKSPRTEYDHIMLRFHDLQKADTGYQRSAPQEWFAFPPGATWVCFSDQVMHAVMEGQHLFEQTFYLPVEGQWTPEASPLRVLEKMTGRRLAA
jgi:hypothetical protein